MFIKEHIVRQIGLIKISTIERLRYLILMRQKFNCLYDLPIYDNRNILWDKCVEIVGKKTNVTYIEFGVFKGETIKHFASKNLNSSSLFLGLDTFTGYPIPFAHLPKGYRNCDGVEPSNEGDLRINFIKGLFINTFEQHLSKISDRAKDSTFVVYFYCQF